VYINFSSRCVKQLPKYQSMALPELKEELASGYGGWKE
jgi:hypothetical protein